MFRELIYPSGLRGATLNAAPCFAPLADCPAGLMYGMAVYTTFRFPLANCWLNAHLSRLAENAGQLGLTLHFSEAVIRGALETLVVTEGWASSVLRLTAIADVQEYGDFYSEAGASLKPARLLLSVRKAAKKPLAEQGLQPAVALKTVDAMRVLPLVKHSGMADVIRLRQTAIHAGFPEILLAQGGIVREVSTSNCFVIQAGQLLTPDPVRDGCLPGITRQRVLLAAESLGIPVAESAPLMISERTQWEGAFLTNAVQGIRPVSQIDDHPLPWPPEALALMNALAESLN